MIKSIIFDIGGVLVTESSDLRVRGISNYLDVDIFEYLRLKEKYKDLLSTGKISLKKFYKEVLKVFDKNDLKSDAVLKEHFKIYKKESKIDKQIINLIKNFKKKYTVVCLTNTEPEIAEFNKKRKLFDIFEKSFISTDLKMKKPDKEIYNYVLQQLKCSSSEVVFIDDKPENVEGARCVGIKSIVFKNINQLKNELKYFGVNS